MRRKPAGRLHRIAAGRRDHPQRSGAIGWRRWPTSRGNAISRRERSMATSKAKRRSCIWRCRMCSRLRRTKTIFLIVSVPRARHSICSGVRSSEMRHGLFSRRGYRSRGTGPHAEDIAEVAAELFDMMHRRRRAIWLLDQCAKDVPEIAALYVRHVKVRYLQDLEAFISRGQSGRRIYPDVDAASAARGVLEMVAWFAMHRLRDVVPLPCSEEKARGAAISLAVNALCRSPVKCNIPASNPPS